MGLWARLKRVFFASTGAALDKIENPELVLQQTIRDMRDRVPELNNSVAQVMATERLLIKNQDNLEQQVVDLDSKIKASVKMGRDDIATAYIGQLQQAQLDLTADRCSARDTRRRRQSNALKARDNYVLNMKKRTAEAMQLISAAKQAKLQEQLAQTMEAFNIGDDASTFNEMREKIDRRVAAAEAKLQLGTSIGRFADAGHRTRSDGHTASGQAARIQTTDGHARLWFVGGQQADLVRIGSGKGRRSARSGYRQRIERYEPIELICPSKPANS